MGKKDLYYEVHLTVSNVKDIEKFKEDCVSIGVKPILIHTQNKNHIDEQVMTSSKYIGNDWKVKICKLTEQLYKLGYEVIRQKVEIQPDPINKHSEFIYYEIHIRLKFLLDAFKSKTLSNKIDYFMVLDNLCEKYNFHKSRNIFKADDQYFYQMITYRNVDINYQNFVCLINQVKDELDNNNFVFDKIEIEEAIFDSNVLIDNTWLKTSV